MEILFKDPKTFLFAVLGGVLPAVLWLWFWLREEDAEEREPLGLIILSFILGSIFVLIAIQFEKYSLTIIKDNNFKIVLWAVIEEVTKLIAAMTVIYASRQANKPIDYPMYFIAVALGFAAFENMLYIINPLGSDGTIVALFTSNLRYLGSTLLHLLASSMIGSALGLSFYTPSSRFIYFICGLMYAIVLHSVFNFFIMKGSGVNIVPVFGFLWVVAIINILIFEKLKRMGNITSTK